MEKLKVINLAKSYDRDVPVLRDISFCVDDRDFFVILGPSGCGKTTLLNIIAGVEDINGGEIYIDGIRVNENKPQKRDVAMVFQNYALYPTMNVFDNIAFPLRNRHFKKKEIEGKVLSVAKLGSIWFSDYAMLMLGLVISTVPVILIFLICSKPFGRAIIRQ